MKVKFKSADGRVATLDSLYIDINYGSGLVNVIKAKSIDSVTIPLRVDNNPFTEISLRTTNKGNSSKIKNNVFFKIRICFSDIWLQRLYENVGGTLVTPNPVIKIEQNQDLIIDENKTHFYFIF